MCVTFVTLSEAHFEEALAMNEFRSCDTLRKTEAFLFVITNVIFNENFSALSFIDIVPYSDRVRLSFKILNNQTITWETE